jgi:CheY-like chemotaxis protein
MDGITATQKLREAGVKTSIMALTANAMAGFEKECLDAGYSGYLSKPVDLDQFMTTMADLLGGRQVAAAADMDSLGSLADRIVVPGDGSDENTATHHVAPTTMRELPATVAPVISKLGSMPQFQKIIEKFIKKLKGELEKADSAWQSGNAKEVALIAHWLKGSAGTVGFDEFTEPAAQLEMLAKKEQMEAAGRMLARLKRLSEAIVPPEEIPGRAMPQTSGAQQCAANS